MPPQLVETAPKKTLEEIKSRQKTRINESKLFFVSLLSLPFLRFSAPFSFSLCPYPSSRIAMRRAGFSSVPVYVCVKGSIVDLILLKGFDVLVQLLFDFGVGCFVVDFRIGEISDVELKVTWIVN